MSPTLQDAFALALRDPDLPAPPGVVSHGSHKPLKRFAVYRNNVMVGLIGALEARFPATKRIVGEDFFTATARLFASAHPPRSPLMMTYGDEFPAFLAGFEPAAQTPYLADVARLEAARTRAYHAADAQPLEPSALAAVAPEALGALRFRLHPSVEIVASTFPVVTIWAMNAGEMELAPLTDWAGQDALVVRPRLDVEVRSLPDGARIFLQCLGSGQTLGEAAETALAARPGFDIAVNLAALFSTGVAVDWMNEPQAPS
jgi:hypothetical protein